MLKCYFFIPYLCRRLNSMTRKAIVIFLFSLAGSFYFQTEAVSAIGYGASFEKSFESAKNNNQKSSVDLQQQIGKDFKQEYFQVVSNKRFLDSQPFCFPSIYSFLNPFKAVGLHAENSALYFSLSQRFDASRAPPISMSY